jgi:putative salt-induced outer membrane protein YdiY
LNTAVAVARGDTVTLKNGDRINGTVGQIVGGKMSFKSPVLGDISIDMNNVESYTTDAPASIRMISPTSQPVTDKISVGDKDRITTARGRTIATADVKAVNPPPQDWTGRILFTGALARGNTDTFDIGLTANAALRRDDEFHNDRTNLGGAYNFGRTGRGDDKTTTTDNWNVVGKYDQFWSPKFYGYATTKVEHDRIASLRYRLAPGVGVGYQWIESPAMNFNTEAGVTYVYEDFDTGGNDEFVALRLAYHFDKRLADNVGLFHNLEWLPSFADPGDYLLNTDAGVRVDLTASMFSEFKVELKRDSQPAEGALKNDLRYILGVGWSF